MTSASRPTSSPACSSRPTRRPTCGAGVRHAGSRREAQRRRFRRRAGGRAGEGDQLPGRRPGAGLPAAGEHGARPTAPTRSTDSTRSPRDGAARPSTDTRTAAGSASDPPTPPGPARAGAFALDFLPGVAVIATMALLDVVRTATRVWLWWVFTACGRAGRVRDGGQSLAAAGDHGLDAGPRAVRASAVHDAPTARPRQHPAARCATWPTCSTRRRCSSDGCGRCGTSRHRTFADLLLRTEVRVVDRAAGSRAHGRPPCVAVAAAACCARRRGTGLSGGVPAGPCRRAGPRPRSPSRARASSSSVELRHSTRCTTTSQRRRALATDAVPAAAGRPAAGRAEGGRHRQRILGGEQRGAVGDARSKRGRCCWRCRANAAPTRTPEVHHRDRARGLREVRRTAGGASPILTVLKKPQTGQASRR